MNILNYSLTAIISYLGLFIGFLLAVIAKEELKPGKKYFIFLQKIILLLIFIFLVVFIDLNYILVLLILSFIIISVFKRKKEFNELPYIYIILSVIFFLSSKILNLFIIESSLIFLYGLPTGSLLTKKSKKETMINILKNVGFVIVSILIAMVLNGID